MTLTGWVKRVNIQTQVDWVLGANSVADLFDDAINTNGINLSRLHNLEPTVSVVLVIGRSTERRADASVDVGVILQQTLLRSMVEVGAVIDAGDLGWGAAKDLWFPWCSLAIQYLYSSHSGEKDEGELSEKALTGVQVAIEVDHRDGSICAVDGSQQREGDGVVTAQRDDTGKCLALLRGAELVGVGGGGTREDAVMTLLDLVKSPSVVVPEVSSLII